MITALSVANKGAGQKEPDWQTGHLRFRRLVPIPIEVLENVVQYWPHPLFTYRLLDGDI